MIFLRLLALAILISFAMTGCDYGRMYDQESVQTNEKKMPQQPPGTVPISGGVENLIRTEPKALKNPLPRAPASFQQGKEAYFNYCVQCHGPQADGNGTVGQSFAPLPSNLTDPQVQGKSDGELFYNISLGFGRHPALASTVAEEDRWAVVNYIRSLQGKPKG
jgi:mono/diheme cytochrome c family protein